MIRIGADARCLNRTHLRGVGKYLLEVVRHASRQRSVEWELFADRPDLVFHEPRAESVRSHCFDTRGYRFHRWEQLSLPHRARAHRLDVLHCPASTLPWYQPLPTVVTVHDVLPWVYDEPDWKRGWYLDWLLPNALMKSAAVITDSKHSRREILRLWPALADRLHVISLGVADQFLRVQPDTLPDSLRSQGVRQPYLLYIGGEVPRKRLGWALEVLEGLASENITLVICGVEAAARERIERTVRPGLRSQLCWAPFIAEGDMPRLYQNAAAVLYPTLYEGFGLPVVEALAAGTPIIFSDVASLGELRGPGAIVLPPYELNAWICACREMVESRGQAPVPNMQARDWARRYSWDTCAALHLDVYRRAAGSRRTVARERQQRPIISDSCA